MTDSFYFVRQPLAASGRSAAAVTTVIAVIVLPYIVAAAVSILPAGPADWLLRVTPAAAFAVQPSTP